MRGVQKYLFTAVPEEPPSLLFVDMVMQPTTSVSLTIVVHASAPPLLPRSYPPPPTATEDAIAKEYRAAMLKRITEGHTVPGSSAAVATATAANGSDDSEDDDGEDGDEGFLGSYRRRRLEQLKATAGRPHFGQIIEAEPATFVSAVDTEDPRTSVVVHLYEPYIDACRRMNRFLEVGDAVPVLCRFDLVGGCFRPQARCLLRNGVAVSKVTSDTAVPATPAWVRGFC